MTNEERDIITRFVQRIAGAAPAGGSVPGTTPSLPPVDREADSLIGDLFARYPEARYRITQTAFVQEVALAEAQSRLKQMQAELDQARAQPAGPSPWQAPQQAAPAPSRGLFGGLFGGSSAPPPPPQYAPQPQYAPPPQSAPQYPSGYQPGMFQASGGGGGSGFLGSALRTAAGVAGGVVVGNALMDMFSGHHGEGGGFGGGLFGGGEARPEETIVNNYYGGAGPGDQGALPASDPWAGGGAVDPGFGQGGGDDPFSQSGFDSGSDAGGWDAGGSGSDDSDPF
jgi:hypothetical protein